MLRSSPASINQENVGRVVNSVANNAITLLVAALWGAVPIYLYLGWRTGAWQFWVLSGVVALLGGAALLALGWIRSGRTTAGINLAFGGLMVALPVLVALIAQIGALAGFMIILLVLTVGSQTLTSREIRPLLIMAAFTAAVTIGIEFWQPPTQLTSTATVIMLGTMAGLVLIGYLIAAARQFTNYSIFVKLVFTFLVLALVPLILLLVTVSSINHPTLIRTNNDRLTLAAVQTANTVDSFMMSNANALRGEAQLSVLVAYLELPPEARFNSSAETIALNTLRALKSKNEPFITSYALLDETGRVILDTVPANIGIDESERGHFRAHLTERLPFYISPVEFESFDGAANIYFSSSIWEGDRLLGVLRARYDSIIFQELMVQSSLLAGEESYPFIVDDNLLYLGHAEDATAVHSLITAREEPSLLQLQSDRRLPPRDPRVQFAPDLAASLQAEGDQRLFVSEAIDRDGRPVQAAVAHLNSFPGWQVVVYQPRAIFTAPIANQLNASLVLASVIALVAASGAFAISQRLGDPIRRLTEQAQRVAEGDLNVQMSVESSDEIGLLANAFNQMTAELRRTLSGLEERVAERTRALELTTDVSRRLSTILEQDKLVTAVVEQIKQAFDYYHVHIYLLDEASQTLRMAGGTGEVGQALLAANHSLPMGKGLVGRAALNKRTILVSDTYRDLNWVANALLPDTKAELAVPILLGDELLGVIDVQEDTVNGLTQDDASLIQAIALQVAIGLQNAQAVARTQRQAERQALLNSVAQQIQGAVTVEEALQVAAREIGRATGSRQTIVKLRPAETADSKQPSGEVS
jgi:GAF domain-containing protein/HAMP domain-containing protein